MKRIPKTIAHVVASAVRSGFSLGSRPCQSPDSRHNKTSPFRKQSPRNAISNSCSEGEPGWKKIEGEGRKTRQKGGGGGGGGGYKWKHIDKLALLCNAQSSSQCLGGICWKDWLLTMHLGPKPPLDGFLQWISLHKSSHFSNFGGCVNLWASNKPAPVWLTGIKTMLLWNGHTVHLV